MEVSLNSRIRQYVQRFDAQTLRERSLVAVTLLGLMCFFWWNYFAEPMMQNIEARQADNLREETVELIDSEKMLQLMTQLGYRESILRLMSLKRCEVRPAIPREEGENSEEPDIHRHLLEIELVGKYADMLGYMQTLEQLDWKLLRDEIEVLGEEYPAITLKLVLSTLSKRKEWIVI